MSIVIKVENLSKVYQLGSIGTGTLSHDIERWFAVIRGKEDPFLMIGETSRQSKKAAGNLVLSLNDINFEVKQGEVLGIIGRNGSGKSTLLKILSRITSPTKGNIKIKGRIASLLEVGTGFHPELTGRENVYLNGAILGMKKAEIRKKFDEIVDFAGVERYVDTPVKRYSSGMYVRLAFAVAAFLEPEILIVDEVLAVGDAEFQKKCLGRLQDVSVKDGRTVLFVSHNMPAISAICSQTMLLQDGNMVAIGDTRTVIDTYLNNFKQQLWKQEWDCLENAPGNEFIKILRVELIPHFPDPLDHLDVRTSITVKFRFRNFYRINLSTDLLLFTLANECVFDVATYPEICDEGVWEGKCTIPGNFLNNGSYYFSMYFVKDSVEFLYIFENCLRFEVEDYCENIAWIGKWRGYVRPQFAYSLMKV